MICYRILIFFLNVLTFVFALTSCVSQPSKTSVDSQLAPGIDLGQMVRCESKAVVKDLIHNKTHRLSVDFLAVGQTQMRIEVSAILGVGVASILFKNNETKYASYREKKFFQIQNFDRSLEDIFKVPLRPNYFFKILYGQGFEGDHWHCSKNKNNLVEHCTQDQENLVLNWEYPGNGKRHVHIQSPKTEISWTFDQLQSETSAPPQAFELEAPHGFRVIKL